MVAAVASANRSSETPAALRLTDAERGAVVRRIMGRGDPDLGAFPAAVRRVVFDRHARYVQPLIERHWPECLAERAGRKLRFLTCNLYATAPYTVLFSAPEPPFPVGPARVVGAALGLSTTSLSRLAGRAVGWTAALLPEITERRILLFAGFIATIDHVYDHCFDAVAPVERGRRMRGLLDGTWAPDATTPHAGAFRLVRALHDEMQAGITNDDDQRELDRALSRLRDYVDAEVKAMTGVPDPSGCSWRMPGVLGTIDGLVFPVWRYAGEQARQWMYDVSLFVQVLDDFLDVEKDSRDIRPTPMLTGYWTEETLERIWNKTLDGIVALARASGVTDENWLAFVRETYRMMALETAEAMGAGTAD
jgi:hypothetical protein